LAGAVGAISVGASAEDDGPAGGNCLASNAVIGTPANIVPYYGVKLRTDVR